MASWSTSVQTPPMSSGRLCWRRPMPSSTVPMRQSREATLVMRPSTSPAGFRRLSTSTIIWRRRRNRNFSVSWNSAQLTEHWFLPLLVSWILPGEIFFMKSPRRVSHPGGEGERSEGQPRLHCEQGGGHQEMVLIAASPVPQVSLNIRQGSSHCSHSLSIFRLRNPQGSGQEWTGDLSELWDKLPQRAKDEMKKSK